MDLKYGGKSTVKFRFRSIVNINRDDVASSLDGRHVSSGLNRQAKLIDHVPHFFESFVIFRSLICVTEASSEIGYGHFMRCYALAEEAIARNLSVFFFMPDAEARLTTLIRSTGSKYIKCAKPWDQTLIPTLDEHGATSCDWIVLDSYSVRRPLLLKLSSKYPVLMFDDLCELEFFDCRLIVNAALNVSDAMYQTKLKAGRLLAGPQYAMVRSEFLQYNKCSVEDAITIILGGSDPRSLTTQCVYLVADALPKHEIRVIAGPANQRLIDLQTIAANCSRIEVHFAPENLVALLASSTLVVTAAGNTVAELCALGKAAVVLVIADNQIAALDACPYPVLDSRCGLSSEFTQVVKALAADPERRSRLIESARKTVDGLGSRRVIDRIMNEAFSDE